MRPTWNETLMNTAVEIAKRSTCSRMKTAAVLVRDNRIISMGYNGVPKGREHCEEYFKKLWKREHKNKFTHEEFLNSTLFFNLHHQYSINNEVHAEMNAILFAAKNGVKTESSTLYTVYSPCVHCAKSILQAGIKEVLYKYEYERDPEGIKFLKSNKVECKRI